MLKDKPIGRLITPEEVAAAVLYLLLARRGAITGTTLMVAGGEIMMDERTSIPLDAETKVAERPDDHKAELRLWLRLLTCTTLIEGEVRRRLRDQFDVTLPRFDLMAQLDKRAERHDARRVVAAHDGVERQRHRAGRAPRRAGPARPPRRAERPPRADRQPHRRRPQFFRSMARAQRRLDRRDFRRARAGGHRGADAAARQDQAFGAQGAERTETRHERGQSRHAAAVGLPGAATCASPSTARSRR